MRQSAWFRRRARATSRARNRPMPSDRCSASFTSNPIPSSETSRETVAPSNVTCISIDRATACRCTFSGLPPPLEAVHLSGSWESGIGTPSTCMRDCELAPACNPAPQRGQRRHQSEFGEQAGIGVVRRPPAHRSRGAWWQPERRPASRRPWDRGWREWPPSSASRGRRGPARFCRATVAPGQPCHPHWLAGSAVPVRATGDARARALAARPRRMRSQGSGREQQVDDQACDDQCHDHH